MASAGRGRRQSIAPRHQEAADRRDQNIRINWHRQEHAEPFRVSCVFPARDKHDLSARPLHSDHARQSDAVRSAGTEIHAGDQHADAGTGFYRIQRPYRILEPGGLKESRSDNTTSSRMFRSSWTTITAAGIGTPPSNGGLPRQVVCRVNLDQICGQRPARIRGRLRQRDETIVLPLSSRSARKRLSDGSYITRRMPCARKSVRATG